MGNIVVLLVTLDGGRGQISWCQRAAKRFSVNVVHYVDEGSGPILLMLHGNPVWSFVYREVIVALRDRFRCIAMDFPGFGLSVGAPGYRYLAQDHASLLVSFLDRLDLSQLTLVGHNWGGPFGLYAAQQRPDRFERLH